jgi:type IV pilus assembly protein PilV
MLKPDPYRQRGMTLIEVLVSVLILAIGLLGAAAIQLNALKYTDSATLTSQASFIAYDMMDRIRANVDGNATANGSTNVLASYLLVNLAAAPTGAQTTARDQDLADFRANIQAFSRATGEGSIDISPTRVVTITITWDDTRAASAAANASGGAAVPRSTFRLASQIGVTP